LVLIDPKMVELVRFNGVHLMGKVEAGWIIVVVLRWCTQEMDHRYRELEREEHGPEAYNAGSPPARRPALPRVVILIDELADLMMMARITERTLVRLAGRACHRDPSGRDATAEHGHRHRLIKANFPAAFLPSRRWSLRVILDGAGAETLLGKGDMLFLSAEASAPVRLLGVFVGDAEVARLVDYWREAAEPQPTEAEAAPAEAPWEELIVRAETSEEQDEILEQAIALVRKSGFASASMLQRRLRIGYPRAARLMDELEELGVVGRSQTGGKTREVLVRDEDEGEEPDEDEG
jgi:S-DNA-T family DNA segregation ATPase FtsK/SpoIIIE